MDAQELQTLCRHPGREASLGASAASERIEAWLVHWLSRFASLQADVIEKDRPIFEYGVTSLSTSRMVSELSRWLGTTVDAGWVWQYRTIARLAHKVAGLSPTLPASDSQPASTTVRGESERPPHPAVPSATGAADNALISDLAGAADDDFVGDPSALLPQRLARVDEQRDRQVLIGGRWRSDFASCNYLGLDLHPQVIASVLPAITAWGVHPSWSRELASPAPFEALENDLATLVGAAHTLVFPSLTLLHLGIIPLLVENDGVIFKDIAAHHTMYEACCRAQSNGAGMVEYAHNNLQDLEQLLQRYPLTRKKLIVIDGIYSVLCHRRQYGRGSNPSLGRARDSKKLSACLYQTLEEGRYISVRKVMSTESSKNVASPCPVNSHNEWDQLHGRSQPLF